MEYHVVHQSLVPMGELSETLNIFRIDAALQKCEMAVPLQFNDIGWAGAFPVGNCFIKGNGFPSLDGTPAPEIRDFLQAMADAAWKLGIKPREAIDAQSELKALRYHLEDMRTIAIKDGAK